MLRDQNIVGSGLSLQFVGQNFKYHQLYSLNLEPSAWQFLTQYDDIVSEQLVSSSLSPLSSIMCKNMQKKFLKVLKYITV